LLKELSDALRFLTTCQPAGRLVCPFDYLPAGALAKAGLLRFSQSRFFLNGRKISSWQLVVSFWSLANCQQLIANS